MKHTPEPWYSIEGEPYIIKSEEGDHIADIWLVATGFKEANARLIAAAPEMFALLNEWLDTPFFETKEEWREWVEDYRPRVEQALAQEGDA